jgi:hypothetical protein
VFANFVDGSEWSPTVCVTCMHAYIHTYKFLPLKILSRRRSEDPSSSTNTWVWRGQETEVQPLTWIDWFLSLGRSILRRPDRPLHGRPRDGHARNEGSGSQGDPGSSYLQHTHPDLPQNSLFPSLPCPPLPSRSADPPEKRQK